MKIKTLVENTSCIDDLNCEHGISFYIETKDEKLLFDLGMTNLFLVNAKKMGVNIEDVDNVIISHGHNDHGGGLKYFLDSNDHANVYVNSLAFDEHYAKRLNDKMEYIGLDRSLVGNKRIIFTNDKNYITDHIWTFSNVEQINRLPLSNNILYSGSIDHLVKDLFKHEQDLVIEEDSKLILFTGCSHNGIVNILEHFKKLVGRYPDYCIGGFHLSSRTAGSETLDYVQNLAHTLLDTKTVFYTCHCTGLHNYQILKEIMKDKIFYLATGSEVTLN